jgi:hypothetical protein
LKKDKHRLHDSNCGRMFERLDFFKSQHVEGLATESCYASHGDGCGSFKARLSSGSKPLSAVPTDPRPVA